MDIRQIQLKSAFLAHTLILMSVLLSAPTSAQSELNLDDSADAMFWLKLEEGQQSKDGYTLLTVETIESEDAQSNSDNAVKVAVLLPEDAGDTETERLTIEEVTVYGQAQDQEQITENEIEQLKPFEIIQDPITGRHGIVLYIGEKQPIRVNVNYFDGYRFH